MSSVKHFRGSRKVQYNGKTYKSGTVVYEKMLRVGVPIAEIARKLKVSYPAVLLYKQAQEKKGRTYPKIQNEYEVALNRAAFAALLATEEKWSRKQIAEAFGMTYAAISFMLKTACVTVPDLRKVENRKLRTAGAAA